MSDVYSIASDDKGRTRIALERDSDRKVLQYQEGGSIHAASVSHESESGQLIVMASEVGSNVRDVKRNKQSGTKVSLSGLLSRSASNESLRSDQVRLVWR